jgi:hypothetical protein
LEIEIKTCLEMREYRGSGVLWVAPAGLEVWMIPPVTFTCSQGVWLTLKELPCWELTLSACQTLLSNKVESYFFSFRGLEILCLFVTSQACGSVPEKALLLALQVPGVSDLTGIFTLLKPVGNPKSSCSNWLSPK